MNLPTPSQVSFILKYYHSDWYCIEVQDNTPHWYPSYRIILTNQNQISRLINYRKNGENMEPEGKNMPTVIQSL